MHRFSGPGWAPLVFACSILLASAGAAAGGSRGDKDGGHHDGRGGGSEKADGGGKGDRGAKSPGAGKGKRDAHQGRSSERNHRADRRAGNAFERRLGRGQKKGNGGQGRADDDLGKSSQDTAAALNVPAPALDLEAAYRAGTAALLASTTAIASSAAEARGERSSLELPAALQPREDNVAIPDETATLSIVNPIGPSPAIPEDIVRACQAAIETAAAPLGATDVRVSSAGTLRHPTPDSLSAPVEVSIDYARQGGTETRQSPVTCELDAAGTVTGLL